MIEYLMQGLVPRGPCISLIIVVIKFIKSGRDRNLGPDELQLVFLPLSRTWLVSGEIEANFPRD